MEKRKKTIRYVDPGKIKPDPKNPRTTFDEAQVEGMAASLLSEGMINPIEIDDNNMIVTGEIRWRGAVNAGLNPIPTTLFNPETPAHRLLRQLVENLHQGSLPNTHGMTPWDTGKAFDRVLKSKCFLVPGTKKQGQGSGTPQVGSTANQGFTALGERLGCSQKYIAEHVKLVRGDEGEPLKKAAKEGRLSSTAIPRAVKAVPEEYQEVFSEAIYDTPEPNTGVVREIAAALKERPADRETAQAIVDVVKTAKSGDAAKKQIAAAAPNLGEALGTSRKHSETILAAADTLRAALTRADHVTKLSRGQREVVEPILHDLQVQVSTFVRTDESPLELDDPDTIEGEFREVK